MSYLDPRGGRAPSGDDTNVPAPYVHGLPGEEPDPYAGYRRSAGVPGDEEPAGDPAAPYHPGPVWNVPTAATSTSQAEWELTAGGPRGRGRRRAGKSGSTAEAGAPVTGRAGRNLPAALAVGTGLILVVLASLLVWPPAFLGVIVLASVVGIWEVSRAVHSTGARPPLVPLIAGGVLLPSLAWFAGEDALILGLVVTVLAALVWRLADGPAAVRRDLTATVLIAVYVPFLLSFGVLLVQPEHGEWWVICTLLAVVLSDTGGYAAGVFLGKHPMAPTISPKKSWEGFGGSVTAAAIGSSLLLYFLLDVPFYWGLLFGLVIAVVAVVGDLAESMLKRDLRIKDMSHLLPGHGGVMDRLDSILFAVPTAYLLLSLIVQPR